MYIYIYICVRYRARFPSTMKETQTQRLFRLAKIENLCETHSPVAYVFSDLWVWVSWRVLSFSAWVYTIHAHAGCQHVCVVTVHLPQARTLWPARACMLASRRTDTSA